jgi:hypothetical protein
LHNVDFGGQLAFWLLLMAAADRSSVVLLAGFSTWVTEQKRERISAARLRTSLKHTLKYGFEFYQTG